jgi:hypothetical protein
MDNQNTDPNQVPVAPQQQTSYTQPQNVVPRKPNVKKGLVWFCSPFLTLIGVMIFIVLMHVIKAPAAIVDMVGFLGGYSRTRIVPDRDN